MPGWCRKCSVIDEDCALVLNNHHVIVVSLQLALLRLLSFYHHVVVIIRMRTLEGVCSGLGSVNTISPGNAVSRSGAIDRFDLRLPRDNRRFIRVEPLDRFLVPFGSVAPDRLG